MKDFRKQSEVEAFEEAKETQVFDVEDEDTEYELVYFRANPDSMVQLELIEGYNTRRCNIHKVLEKGKLIEAIRLGSETVNDYSEQCGEDVVVQYIVEFDQFCYRLECVEVFDDVCYFRNKLESVVEMNHNQKRSRYWAVVEEFNPDILIEENTEDLKTLFEELLKDAREQIVRLSEFIDNSKEEKEVTDNLFDELADKSESLLTREQVIKKREAELGL